MLIFYFRTAEDAFVKDRDTTQPGGEWEKICRLCEFNPKNSKNTKDVSRLRSILLQLKQTPLMRWNETVSFPETEDVCCDWFMCRICSMSMCHSMNTARILILHFVICHFRVLTVYLKFHKLILFQCNLKRYWNWIENYRNYGKPFFIFLIFFFFIFNLCTLTGLKQKGEHVCQLWKVKWMSLARYIYSCLWLLDKYYQGIFTMADFWTLNLK